jgi:hypothetical protein
MKQIIILVLVLLVSCNAGGDKTSAMQKDPILTKVFTTEEISDLQMIVDYFDKSLLGNADDFDSLYQQFFRKIDKSESYDILISKIHLDAPEFQTMLSRLKESGVYDEIWVEFINKLNNKKTLDFNLKGKYFQFLKLMSNEYPFLKNYISSIESMGGNNVSAQAGMNKIYYSKVDFNKPVIRLIWAVHYITVVSSIESSFRK